jgi:hypothetical protein
MAATTCFRGMESLFVSIEAVRFASYREGGRVSSEIHLRPAHEAKTLPV